MDEFQLIVMQKVPNQVELAVEWRTALYLILQVL